MHAKKDSLGIASFRQMEASLQINEEYNVKYLTVNLQSCMCSLGHADVARWLSGLAIKSRGRIIGRIFTSVSVCRSKISDRNRRPIADVKQQQRICPCRGEEVRQNQRRRWRLARQVPVPKYFSWLVPVHHWRHLCKSNSSKPLNTSTE